MSTDITSLSGYNQQDYTALLTEYTQRTGKTEEQFKTYLNSIITKCDHISGNFIIFTIIKNRII